MYSPHTQNKEQNKTIVIATVIYSAICTSSSPALVPLVHQQEQSGRFCDLLRHHTFQENIDFITLEIRNGL